LKRLNPAAFVAEKPIFFKGRIVKKTYNNHLKYAAAPMALAFALISAPVSAQDQPADEAKTSDSSEEADTIVVTGSLFRRSDANAPSPVTIVSSEDLDKRGITTLSDAILSVASNNGPALTNSFSANGAFAGGASAVSLRGLSTNSTLVLFDGLRSSYYPLADDGQRNFVDLNTIPDDIVERVEVLRDGASASYGADAIAGVVNIITKRQFTGVSGRAEAGISQRGIAANQRLSLTAGKGDLQADGFNAYISGFYLRSAAIYNRDLPAPYNTSDQRSIAFNGNNGPNNITNGLDIDGLFQGFTRPSDIFVRPYDATNTTPQGRFQLLNPTAGCRYGPAYSLTPTDLAILAQDGSLLNASSPLTACQEDGINRYGVVAPKIERFGFSGRVTVALGSASEAYAELNFQQSTSAFSANPSQIRANGPTGINFPRFSTANSGGAFAPGSGPLTLPVYVCAARVNCTAANGTLNPNNPFAALGQVARISGAIGDVGDLQQDNIRSRVYRFATGIKGTILGDVDYNIEGTLSHTDLRRKREGYIFIQRLLDVIADGTYNFVNPSANSKAVLDYVTPANIVDASSDLYQAQVTFVKPLAQLPGGPLQLALGGSFRYEAIDAPSGNPDANGPTQRYFVLNAFGTSGSRTVVSGFGELNAPIFDRLEVNAAARYDKYSSGQSAFSPKFGIKFTPFDQLILRGTYSRGFRIPSFAEANALPTTGFVPIQIPQIPNSFLTQYGAGCTSATPAGCPTYLTASNVGLTTLASPDLNPEKSRSFTAGVVIKPIRNVAFTVDYYNIKKTGAITTPSTAPALAAYYANQPIPAGFTVIADAPDPNNPTARPRIAFVQSNLVNSNSQKSEGIDFGLNGTFEFGDITWTSRAEASLILELSTTFPDGSKESYVDTLGNFNLTAGSGTFRWRGNWSNTLDFNDKFALTATLNYVNGYDLSAEDQSGPGTAGQGGLNPGYVPQRVSNYITLDLNGNVKINDKFSFYVNVINALDKLPPIDPVTYGAYLYNPVQGGNGILGRQFRAGVKFGF
jgi:iron complex outermembrane recepter protein